MNYRTGLSERPQYDVVEKPWCIKVNANETNMNLPPLVFERVMSRLSHVAFNRYPNEEEDFLKEAIAKSYSLTKQNVLLGGGSSEIIEKLFYSFGGDDKAIVYPMPSFSMYRIYAYAADAKGVVAPLKEDYSFDAEEFIETVNKNNTSLAVLCNPNNPTGGAVPVETVEHIVKNISCPFLVDEAYMEFYGKSATPLLKKYPNLLIARTFSKAYGLAAARVGYLLADEKIIDMVSRSFMPYHMNVLSLVTADIVYQMRHEYEPRIAMIISERKRVAAELAKIDGIKVYPSETNFLLVKCGNGEALNEAFVRKNIGVRSFGKAKNLENCLRISMGLREENDEIIDVIKLFSEGRD
ncbi:MAG: histidinol-phosphate transaminase [Selenomonadaceae bacterium]|nr:histidinol-phosphate transaminase [Selenomonadaceae bacterium]